MRQNYKLKFTPIAYEDLDQIYGYIAENLHANNAADKLMDDIEKKISRLKNFPFSCEYVSDDLLKEKGYRKLIINNYIVFYLVNEKLKTVIIMRIIYGAMQYKKIL